MEIVFADRMKDFEEGIFQVLNEKKNELEAQGRKVYNLSVGTPDFKPAQYIIDAVVEAAKKPENYKYALADLPELTEAVIHRFRKRYGAGSGGNNVGIWFTGRDHTYRSDFMQRGGCGAGAGSGVSDFFYRPFPCGGEAGNL